MSLGEFLAAGRAYAELMDPDAAGTKPPPSDDDFDGMLAALRELGIRDVDVLLGSPRG
jgi:hypothetical protein